MEHMEDQPRIRFFCDLDHTLIYSHRVPIHVPKTEVEQLNGKPQSYMTQGSLAFLRSQRLARLIPVTTRTRAQYDRIRVLGSEIPCRYALICNGGVLLIDGVEDEAWYRESLSLVADALPQLEAAKNLVKTLSPDSRIHDAHGLFFYFKHSDPESFSGQLTRLSTQNSIRILFDRHKVYCLPKSLDKGSAIARYAKRFGSAMTVAAGDSEFDLPMLCRADLRIVPPALQQLVPRENTFVIEEGVFSDGICSCLHTIAKRGNPQK